MRKTIITLAIVAFASLGLVAQTKVAHINSSELLQKMPEMKDIESKVAIVEEQYRKMLTQKQADMQKMYEDLIQDTLSPPELLAIKKKDLEQAQVNYQKLEQQARTAMQTKQNEFLEPIIKKLKDAIEVVAKEKGYDYVMDATSGGGIIYSNPAHDLMSAVKAKLGIQ